MACFDRQVVRKARYRTVRQSSLPLPENGPEGPWTQLPVDLPPAGQDRQRVVPPPGGPTKSTARDRRIPALATVEPRMCRGQYPDLPVPPGRGDADGRGKKTAQTMHQEVAHEVSQLREVILRGRRHSGRLDWEAVEMASRTAMHGAGAAVLSQLLSSSEAPPHQAPCGCGQQAPYHHTRPKQLTTVGAEVCCERAYYVCSHGPHNQSPRERQRDVQGRHYAPGLRRMMAVVGISTLRGSIFGSYRRNCSLPTRGNANAAPRGDCTSSTAARSRRWSRLCAAFPRRRTRWRSCSPTKPTTSSATPSGCAIPSFSDKGCLSAGVWSRPAARP